MLHKKRFVYKIMAAQTTAIANPAMLIAFVPAPPVYGAVVGWVEVVAVFDTDVDEARLEAADPVPAAVALPLAATTDGSCAPTV